jgi:HPt (histidine-containing phosphotransfer) domain-containing protein
MYAGGTDWRKNLVEIIEMFIQNADERLEQIDAAGKCGDWPRMTRLAHSLRSASAQLAADRLSTLAGQLEAAVTGLAIGAELAPETLALNAHLTAMRAEFRAVRIGLREIVGSM